jgi:hypothetical protein
VLDGEAAKKIAEARTKNGNSHLVMGLVYAEAGLISDAEREFRELVRKNPDSPIARNLLEKVKGQK